MTQSFVGTREQVLSALMHAIRQFQRQRRNPRLWSLRTVRTCDCHSAWARTPIRAFPPSYRAAQLSGYLRQRIQLRAIAAVTQEAFPLSANRRCHGRRHAERGRNTCIARAILATEETFVRRILPLAITFAALSVSTTGVRADGTWCAHYGTGLEGMNCGFYSFEQCRATVSGVGGFCQANLSSAYAAAKEPRRRYRRNY